MGIKSGFLAVLGWLFIVAAGIFAVLAMINPGYATDMLNNFLGLGESGPWKWTVIFAGGILVVLAIVLLFSGGRRVQREKPIEFTSEVGSMVIEASALEDCLRRTALENEDVTDAHATIKVPEPGQDQPIVCSMRIGIRERPDIPGKGSEIAKRIREKFLEILPMDTPPIVNLDRIAIQRPKPVVTRQFAAVDTGRTQVQPLNDLPSLEDSEDVKEQESPPAKGFTGVVQYPVEEEKPGSEEES